MLNMRYINSNEIYNVNFKIISPNIVELTGDFPVKTDGFVLSREEYEDNWDYSDYITIYGEIEGGVHFSNDGSTRPEIIPDTDTDIEYVPYIPTLDEAKVIKINELSNICNHMIVDGVEINVDGVMEHFSYKDEDQVNVKEIFDLAVQTNVPMYYHADSESCKLYTVEQIIDLYATATTNKMHHITYYNQLKEYVNSLEDVETVHNVEYGQDLEGEYLDTYNASMYQAQLVLEALLAKRNELL